MNLHVTLHPSLTIALLRSHSAWDPYSGSCALSPLCSSSERSFHKGEGKDHFHPNITSAVRAIQEGELWSWWPPFSSPFPTKPWWGNPYFGVMSYLLMSLCEITMTLPNQLTQHAKHVAHVLLCDQSYLTSNCVKQPKVSHNNHKVGTHLKANAHPSYV